MRKIALIALLMISLISGAAFAQEATPEATPQATPQFCGTLSDADCAILNKSQQAMASLDSASFDLQLNATFTNIPQMTQPLNLSITGNGTYGGLGKLRSDMLNNQTDSSKLLTALLTDLDGDTTITINLPPELTAQMGGNVPNTITVQERLVDGIGYLNMDTLQTLMRNPSVHGWYGLDLANYIKNAMLQSPDMFNNPASNMGMMQSYQKAFSDPAFINRFVKLARTDDGSTNMATFEITVNMGALMGNPDFQSIMRQQMQRQNPSMTDDQMNKALTVTSQLFKGMDVSVSETISTDDGYLHSIKGSFAFDATGVMKAESQASGSSNSTSAATPAPQISVDFTYTYSNFNSAPTISAPPNAVIIPYQSLLPGVASA